MSAASEHTRPDREVLFEKAFPSDLDVVKRLPDELRAVKAECGMSEKAFHNLVLAMTEAISNAIVHGNRRDASRSVDVCVERVSDQVCCVVRDQGEGYDPESIDDPTAPENLLREGGRGVFIMRTLSEGFKVTRTKDGTAVEFYCARS